MFPVVPVFRGLVRRRSLRGVRHGGQVVGDGDAAGNDALHGRWDASRRDAHHPGGVPGGGTRRGRVWHGPGGPASPAEAAEGRGAERCHLSASIGRVSVAISHFMRVTQLPDPSLLCKTITDRGSKRWHCHLHGATHEQHGWRRGAVARSRDLQAEAATKRWLCLVLTPEQAATKSLVCLRAGTTR